MNDLKTTIEPAPRQREVARRKAQNLFSHHDERTALVKEIVAKENAENDRKTARLRALRLAKEASEREIAALHPLAGADKPRKRRAPRKIARFAYR